MRNFFVFSALILNASFAMASLQLEHPNQAYVVPGSASSCSDIRSGQSPVPTSIGSDFFKMSTFRLNWSGAGQLVPSAISIRVSDARIEGGTFQCVISGKDLTDTFGGDVFSSGIIDMNNPKNGVPCALACGSIKKTLAAQNESFSTMAEIIFVGYSQDSSGQNVQPIHASSAVNLNFF